MAGDLNPKREPKALASGNGGSRQPAASAVDSANPAIQEIGNARLTLRPDLVFSPRTTDGDLHYVIEDPISSKFFRVGVTEYAFMSLLDGTITLHDALAELSSAMPNHGLSEQDTIAICKWLVDTKLANTTKSADTEELASQAIEAEQRRMAERFNPLMIKLPLGNPNRFFEWLAPLVRWIHAPVVMLLATGLIAYGAYLVFSDWARFEEASHGIFAPSNWLWLAAGWAALKVIHETSHGIACKKYGGAVREWGLIFILFAPLAYVDVTSSWRFRSPWQRIHVAAAGMYIELIIAAVAAIIWSQASPGILSYVCYNIIIMASLSTIVFNANPLMRFDGYYLLSDLIGVRNLQGRGFALARWHLRETLFGLGREPPEVLPPRTRHAVLLYAYGAWI